jgi:hypothetical protein
MNMRRRHKIVRSAVAVVVPLAGWFVFAPAAVAGVPAYDNSQDTVVCTTITKGLIKAVPPLSLIPPFASATTISVSGTLGGCVSPSHPTLVFPEGKSKFKGTINGTTNNCLSLNGPTTGTGALTVTWGATDSGTACTAGPLFGGGCNSNADCTACVGGANDKKVCVVAADCPGGTCTTGTCTTGNGAALSQKTSNVTLPSGAAVGTQGVALRVPASPTFPTAAYGTFVVGAANGVAVAPAVGGGFQGGDAGATSTATLVTTQSVQSALGSCVGKGIKQLNVGLGALNLQ